MFQDFALRIKGLLAGDGMAVSPRSERTKAVLVADPHDDARTISFNYLNPPLKKQRTKAADCPAAAMLAVAALL
jgi:hypothetical protein